MSEETIQICIDKTLPDHLLITAANQAVQENAANAPANIEGLGIEEIAVLTRSLWNNGRTLRVSFMGGDPVVQAKVQFFAQQWSQYANIHFEFGSFTNAEIRISFVQGGSWSYMGTDCLVIPQSQATMNYGWLTPNTSDDEYSRVVLHEFGHALGCIHEHQSPAAGIQWNKDAVYSYYEGPPNNWTQAQVDGSIFAKYSATITQFTAWDPTSIMEYAIPKALTTNGFEVGWNRVLSDMDKQFIATWYPYGRVMIADFSSGQPPLNPLYWENQLQSPALNGWVDPDDLQLVGDFMGKGHDQIFFYNRGGNGGRVMIADFSSGQPPLKTLYWEIWGQSPALNGWVDPGDLQLVGDFMGNGHKQVLFYNRGGNGGRVMIADFSSGEPPLKTLYWEIWGQSSALDGWVDPDDLQLVGDFMGKGYDQVLFYNRGGNGGRVMVADFSSGQLKTLYWENWGQSSALNGWVDPDDLQFVGDFMGKGHAQVLFYNRDGNGGRVMIADFSSGQLKTLYWENWGQSSALNGWVDPGDLQFVGDFMGKGYAQVLFYNRDGNGGRVMIADFSNGEPPLKTLYWENWGQSSALNGWVDPTDFQLVGNFMGNGHAQVFFYNRT